MANIVTNGVINNYSIKPKNLTEYTAFRGVTDFSQIGQFDQFETGYSFLSVLQMPKFMTMLGDRNADYKALVDSFKHMLEYEFRGLDGLPDIQADTITITDGINEQSMIGSVKMDTSVTVSSNYFERRGGLITKFAEMYLTGIKDKMTQAKTYHGLIKSGDLEPSYENEVFTMLYYVTDNTMLRLERAVLLVNCQLTSAKLSELYNSTKGDISNKEISIEWNCFPIMGAEVDKAASVLLKDITGVRAYYTGNDKKNVALEVVNPEPQTALDSSNYLYGIMRKDEPEAVVDLVNAIDEANSY